MIRGLASLAGVVGLCLMLYGLGAQGGVVPLIMPAPPKPLAGHPNAGPKPAASNDLEHARLARWDAERAMAQLIEGTK